MFFKTILFAAVFLAFTALFVSGAALTVTTTSDSGSGSLREAITASNQTGEANTLVFDLPGSGPRIIELVTALPPLAGTISILNDRLDQPVTVRRSMASGTPLFRVFEIVPHSTVVISGLTITNGTTSTTSGGSDGGGILNSSSNLTLRRCTVTGNLSGSFGGGVATSGTAILDAADCLISNNSANGGGGIYAAVSGRTVLTNCTISNNNANNGGGLENSSGGGFRNSTGELRIKSCTFSGNSVRDSGGALYDFVANPDLVSIVNSTITGNMAGYKGGGIAAYNGDTGAYLRLGNTIIAGNSCTSGTIAEFNGHDLAPGLYASDGHNIVGRAPTNITGGGTTTGLYDGVKGDQVGTTKAPIDPKLGPLQMNGGSTATHALLSGSPAINRGDDALAPSHDQRGYARYDVSDVGAFELGGAYALSLLNISTRGRVEGGDNVLIAGFIITGTQQKRLILRACGPSMDVPGSLANPQMELWNSAGQLLAANDDWKQAGNRQEIVNSSLAPTNDAESAILTTLDPGAYTAVVTGVDSTGIGLVEVYDLGAGAEAKLANISTRGFVQSGDDVMIGGFFVSGNKPQKVLIRALGPSLPFSNNLPNPMLELHDQNGAVLQSNDNWRSDQQGEINATGIPPTNDRESAIVSSLAPAAYTAIARDANGNVGIGLVEIYAID
jgi:parallel beta-helix repeat protein